MSKKVIYSLLILLTITSCAITTPINDKTKIDTYDFDTKLNNPFGTIVNLKVEIIDGDDLKRKAYSGLFFLKVLEINGKKVNNIDTLYFEDETSKLPTNDFELYEFLYNEETVSLNSELIKKMKKEYVGKTYKIVGYESGKFEGDPKGYNLYQPIRQNVGFYFMNYIIVLEVESK